MQPCAQKIARCAAIAVLASSAVAGRSQGQAKEANTRVQPCVATTGFGCVQGSVYDSLTGRGLRGAVVRISTVAGRQLTDDAGRFEIDSLRPGTYELQVRDVALDSLGLGGFAEVLRVHADDVTVVRFGTPSLSTLKHGLCADSADLITGIVRSVASSAPLGNAEVHLSWLDAAGAASHPVNAHIEEVVGRTDSDGRYFMCTAPQADATAFASVGEARSGAVPVPVSPRRFVALDLYVNERAPSGIGAAAAVRPTTPSHLVGTVSDTLGNPLSGAIVALDNGEQATTDRAGAFTLTSRELVGSQAVLIKRVGYAAVREIVVLRPDSITRIAIQLAQVTVLAKMEVNAAAAPPFTLRSEFADRKKMGFGILLGPDEMAAVPGQPLEFVLQAIPSLMVSHVPADVPDTTRDHLHPPGSLVILVPLNISFADHGFCEANVYVDGVYTPFQDDVRSLLASQVSAVEVYKRSSEAPQRYVNLRNGCGVILIWTKSAWRR